MQTPLLQIQNVSKYFERASGIFSRPEKIAAVDDVSLNLERNETLGLVGESGCGKSTLARIASRLLMPSTGDVLLNGKSIFNSEKKLRKSLPSRLQMIFQDPYSSLNPRLTIGSSISEPLICAGKKKQETNKRLLELLDIVGLPVDSAKLYPHEFSGGQRQRIAIARAIALEPDVLICDEPVSALDASVQAQVLNMLKDVQDRLGLSYIFISHDLAVISHMCDQIAVMFSGVIVELAPTDIFLQNPIHPYTHILLNATKADKKNTNSDYSALHASLKFPLIEHSKNHFCRWPKS